MGDKASGFRAQGLGLTDLVETFWLPRSMEKKCPSPNSKPQILSPKIKTLN